MSRKFARGLVFAMEDDTLEVIPAAPEAEVVPAELEQVVGEVQSEETEISDLNAAIEEAVEDAETLGDVADVLEGSVEPAEDGSGGAGIDQPAAEITEIAVEAICARLGINTSKLMPSMESFGSTGSRVTATRVSLEGVMEALSKAWETIKKAFAALWVKIKSFLASIFDANTRVLNAAKAAQAQLKGLTGKQPSAEKFENKSIGAAFSIEGKAVNAESALTILSNHHEGTQEFVSVGEAFERGAKSIEKLIDDVANMKKGAQDAGVNSILAEDLSKVIGEIANSAKAKLFEKTGPGEDGFKTYETPQLVGNKVFSIVCKTESATSGAFISFVENTAHKSADVSEVYTLSIPDLNKTVDAILNLAKANDTLKSKQAFVGKFEATVNGLINKAIAKVKSLDGQENVAEGVKEGLSEMRKLTANLGNTFGALALRYPSLSIQAGKMALNYVSASMKLYKFNEPSKAPATAPAAIAA